MVAGGQYRRIKVRPLDVMKPFFILLSIALIFLIMWTTISPSAYVQVPIETSRDQFGRITSSYGICTWKNDERKEFWQACIYLLQTFEFITILILTYYAYRCRNISTEYNESTWIGLILWIDLQLAGMSTLLSILVTNEEEIYRIGSSVIIFFNCISVLLLLFVPKMIALWNEKKEKLEKEVRRTERLERLRRFDALKKAQEDEAAGITRGSNALLALETPFNDGTMTEENNDQTDDGDEGYGMKIIASLDDQTTELHQELNVNLSETLSENELLRQSINSTKAAIINATSLYQAVDE